MADEHDLNSMICQIEEQNLDPKTHGGIFVSRSAVKEILGYLKELQRIKKETK